MAEMGHTSVKIPAIFLPKFVQPKWSINTENYDFKIHFSMNLFFRIKQAGDCLIANKFRLDVSSSAVLLQRFILLNSTQTNKPNEKK